MTTKTTIEADGSVTTFRDWIKADGSTEFKPETGRYHLYVQSMCPFAQRVMTIRSLKGLEKAISQDNLDYSLESREKSWVFSPQKEGCDADSVNGATRLREVYDVSAGKLGASGFVGTVTVPVLYDKKLGRIINTESADIFYMLNSEFNEFCETEEQRQLDLYPSSLCDQIYEIQNWALTEVAFRGRQPFFAQTQEDYNQAIEALFSGFDKAESLLSRQRYLAGSQLTGADIMFFSHLIRFDIVYTQYFCAKKRICDYPALWGYLRDIYQTEAVRKTVDFDQILKGYFTHYRYKHCNPRGIIPVPPDRDYDAPTGRESL